MYRSLIEKIVSILAILLCAYLFYATIWGPYKTTIVHRAIFYGVMLIIFFWSSKSLGMGRMFFSFNIVLAIMAILSFGYVILFWRSIIEAMGATYLSTLQIIVGFLIILIALEAVRRMSFPLLCIALAGASYSLFGNHLPGIFSHAGMDFKRFIYLTAFSHEGIFGLGLAVASSYLFMFILFSTALQHTGASDFLLRLTNSLVGKHRGGPAKSAVIASGLTGTMIGSSIGNVVTTGSITIPMMKKSGFRPHTAGAIEVVASEGGQLVPPIMGAGAFIMAELTGIPYRTIALGAIIPALLYYVSVFIVVDIEAVKLKMQGLKEVEKVKSVIQLGWQFLIPIAVLFYLLLVVRFSVTLSGLVTVIVVILITQARKKTRMSLKEIFTVFDKGTRSCAELTALIGVIGIVQQAFTITGLGPRMSNLLVVVAGGNPILVLIMAMVIAILLGMGMPTPIAYLLTAIFVAPALVEVGFSKLGAHLFLFFFAIKSGSTPPIAVVAVVAAGIAAANWWKTAWLSFLYSLPGFFIAYAFVLYPSYLMDGTLTMIATSLLYGLIGTSGMAYAMQRYLITRLTIWEALMLFAGSLILINMRFLNPIFGFMLVTMTFLLQWKKSRSLKSKMQIAAISKAERR